MSDNFRGSDDSSGSRFQFLQPNRNLQSNWEVDLAKKLEEYLLKICSGELSSIQDHELHAVNFVEAALLLQGSVQVYSQKVEYLYSLVLHALEFISQKRQNKDENASKNPDGIESNTVSDDDNELFLGLDDVPVEAKNLLDGTLEKTASSKHFAKPPANLLVLEGDCLDSSRDGSELESYLLAACNFYGDFLLLDPYDAKAVYDFSRTNDAGKHDMATHAGSSIRSKTCCSPLNSPTARSGGTPHKSNLGKNQGINNITSAYNCAFEAKDDSGSHADHDDSGHDTYHVDEPNLGFSIQRDESDDDGDDPWKPLNPHEPGNLKIKPFKRAKGLGRHVTRNDRCNTQASQFPIAKLDGIIHLEFAQSFEVRKCLQEKLCESQPLPLFEKLRRTFTSGEQGTDDGFCDLGDNDENEIDYEPPDFTQEEINLPNKMYDTDEVPLFNAEQGHTAAMSEGAEAFEHENLDSHTNLEDLCRSHLDALLASIAVTQKQTEMAARVSTWKQRVEHTLEEQQESRPPFDIHLYGERILDKFSLEADSGGCISFSNVVKGQPKHEVARTFSALLQLVNNGNVDLQKASASGELICHTATNPFYVRLCGNGSRRGEIVNGSARKRLISPIREGNQKSVSPAKATSPLKSAAKKGRSSVTRSKVSAIRLTPDGKRRRRSTHMTEPSAG